MPSSDNYRRNYQQEYASQKQRGESGTGKTSGNAKRKKLRRLLLKAKRVKAGEDVDHITPLSKGGANTPANARSVPPSKNRSFPRKANGSMK
jgi:5-methylcytosine-specific restriction endonuclease McrA